MTRSSIILQGICMLSICVAGCSRTPPTAPEEHSTLVGDVVIAIPVVPIDSLVVADVFGDHDNAASADEVKALDDYFTAHREAWCVSGLIPGLRDATAATGDQVRESFALLGTKPYASEDDLRFAYVGINIKTPWVSIVVMQRAGRRCFVERFMRSPGPGIAAATWVDLQLK